MTSNREERVPMTDRLTGRKTHLPPVRLSRRLLAAVSNLDGTHAIVSNKSVKVH